MIRSELVEKIAAENPGLERRDAERIVTTFLDGISEALVRGDRVELRGFGTFSTRERKARTARNPRTGAKVEVGDKRVMYFRAGKELNERINSTS